MRLRKKMVEHVAETVANSLLDKELITLDGSAETLAAEMRRLIPGEIASPGR